MVKSRIDKMLDKMMKDDDELDNLLDEVSLETSSVNLQATLLTTSRDSTHHQYQHHTDHHNNNTINNNHDDNNHNNVVVPDHGYNYGHASCVNVMPEMVNSHGGLGQVYDEELLKYYEWLSLSQSSPVAMNGYAAVQSSRGSSSSSSGLYPGLPSSGVDGLKPYSNGFRTDLRKASYNGSRASFGSGLVDDDFDLSSDFSRMRVSGGGGDRSRDEVAGMNFGRYGGYDDVRSTLPCYDGGYNRPVVSRRPLSLHEERAALLLEMQQRTGSRFGSPYPHSPRLSDQSVNHSDYAHSGLSPQYFRNNVLGANNSFSAGYALSDVSSGLSSPRLADTLFNSLRNGYPSDAFYAPNVRVPYFNDESAALHYQSSPLSNGRNTVPSNGRLSQGGVQAFCGDDSLIIQGQGAASYGMKRQMRSPRGRVLNNQNGAKIYSPLPQLAKCGSLADVKGYIYELAKDQNGCRFLQKVFDEGSPRDVQMIFGEIIDHVDELMTNAFGNYLMQKLLEVCNEEQRTHILLRVLKELVRISLNTHGTRVVQKLIETLKTRQQILLVVSALEPGFLALIKDLNGNHVIQRCLQFFSSEDSKFIYVAAAKYCVEIASHQHGCCVLQRCISHSTGEHRENLVARISADGLLLAQDAYGNYVIQFILDLKIPSAVSKLTALFQNNYAHLSMQKFSSHVVEKCLKVCNDDVRSRIIHELLSAPYFEHVLSDPHANYVIQTALQVSEGPLRNSLLDAIDSHKAISRNSPYSKRIFSQKFLRR